MSHRWIAERSATFDSSGIRKVFDLAAQLEDPINLSIGQPDFDVPQPIRQAAIDAIENGKNGYTPSQGLASLLDKVQRGVDECYGHADRRALITSGTSGGLVLALMALVNPGEEVIVFDPYFVMYDALIKMVGGRPVFVDTYPDFRIDVAKVEAAITPRTKMILANSPANPTGAVAGREELCALAELAACHDVALVSDEIYRLFCYDDAFTSPAEFNEQTIVLDGFSKSYGMTGWRLGYAHGPSEIIDTMIKLQQYTFVCAPQPAQWGGLAALDVDMSCHIADYRRKRDLLVAGLSDHYQVTRPGGAFYAFPRAPRGTASEFVERAIERGLLIIPGKIFSRQDTHFRISYAADDAVIERGVEVLRDLVAS
ncbi:MAG: aminotransferase class I/II-fold pyridoxal phosphate-dependent enzyme [Planctomycetota bacterium]|nr:MAG: aminotransferase class I/II-fold pyridoxal phosphate-dependent enzyme [Planctomycetota bacterium]REK40669.1 MAG: aminotransferase class I/II-fold pyridoxal phosphate-dependent enzyme [Planctomycetota bacterium]